MFLVSVLKSPTLQLLSDLSVLEQEDFSSEEIDKSFSENREYGDRLFAMKANGLVRADVRGVTLTKNAERLLFFTKSIKKLFSISDSEQISKWH